MEDIYSCSILCIWSRRRNGASGLAARLSGNLSFHSALGFCLPGVKQVGSRHYCEFTLNRYMFRDLSSAFYLKSFNKKPCTESVYNFIIKELCLPNA